MNLEPAQRELLVRSLDGSLSPQEWRLVHELLQSHRCARDWLREVAEQAVMIADLEGMSSADPQGVVHADWTESRSLAGRQRWQRWLLVGSVAMIIALSAGWAFQWFARSGSPSTDDVASPTRPVEQPIVRIAGLSGELVWRGDGGQVVSGLQVGTGLPGGTIEGMAPDSWCELEFHDGTTVTISGVSMLTLSDLGQKELRLKEGTLSARVFAQPAGRPLLVHTRSAVLTVLGTRFEVEAELDSTALHVSEGEVTLRRLSDGRSIEVPANHRLLATAEGGLWPQLIPDPVAEWKSQLQRGAECTYGKWTPASDQSPATLKAIPYIPEERRSLTLYLLGLPVRRSDNSPVIALPGSRFVVRGRLTTAADLYFGIRVTRSNGEFAGKFLAHRPAWEFQDHSPFEAVFRLEEFGLDPCVWDHKDELPDTPEGLLVGYAWSFTTPGGPAGLEVTEVELVPPDPD